MPPHADPLRIALQVGLYAFFFVLILWLTSPLAFVLPLFQASAICTFIAAVLTNILTLKIYEGRSLADIGFHWNALSAWHLAWGLGGGALAAIVVLAGPIALHAASLQAVLGAPF